MLPLELIDFICEKIDRKLLVGISFTESHIKYPTNLFYILNRNRLGNYWKNTSCLKFIENNDNISLMFVWYNYLDIKVE